MIARRRQLLHVVAYAARGGCERCCETFIQHADDFGHQVLVLGREGPMTSVWRSLGAEVAHLDLLACGWRGFYLGLRRAVRQLEFSSVVVWTGVRAPLVLAVLHAPGRPVAIHAGNPCPDALRVRVLLQASRLLPQPRAVLVACSSHVARSFRDAPFYRDLRIETCLNPVEVPDENSHAARPLQRGAAVRVGMAARLDPIKDHRTLIQSFARLRRTWPAAELCLAGDGPLRAELAALVAAEGLIGAVHFLGTVADMPAFYRSLDVFAYFTTTQEGMGSALAEALAHGLPCVVSELAVMHEVAGDTRGGAVRFCAADPRAGATALDEVLGDQALRHDLSARAFARAREAFAPRPAIRRYLQLMGEVA